jgi:hypothetical protein
VFGATRATRSWSATKVRAVGFAVIIGAALCLVLTSGSYLLVLAERLAYGRPLPPRWSSFFYEETAGGYAFVAGFLISLLGTSKLPSARPFGASAVDATVRGVLVASILIALGYLDLAFRPNKYIDYNLNLPWRWKEGLQIGLMAGFAALLEAASLGRARTWRRDLLVLLLAVGALPLIELVGLVQSVYTIDAYRDHSLIAASQSAVQLLADLRNAPPWKLVQGLAPSVIVLLVFLAGRLRAPGSSLWLIATSVASAVLLPLVCYATALGIRVDQEVDSFLATRGRAKVALLSVVVLPLAVELGSALRRWRTDPRSEEREEHADQPG